MKKAPFILSLPHCSRNIPPGIKETISLTDLQIYESVDLGTKELFGTLPVETVLEAQWSRLVVDLNRGPDRRDPNGVVALVDYHNRPVYFAKNKPADMDIENRIRAYYQPFHNRLADAFDRPGIKALFDCHSLNGIGPVGAPDAGMPRKDVILSNNGDQRGAFDPARGPVTCPSRLMTTVKGAFEETGFSVALNTPYSGGFIIKHYAEKAVMSNKICVQIEMNQSLFLKSDNLVCSPEKLSNVQRKLYDTFSRIHQCLENRK